jgi:hypothetical protein
MKLEERQAFFREIHSIISRESRRAAQQLADGRYALTYPPNDQFTADEFEALLAMGRAQPALPRALQKAIADASAMALFDMFNLIDGTGDPAGYDGDWGTFDIIPVDEDIPHYHDELFESWHDWHASQAQSDTSR